MLLKRKMLLLKSYWLFLPLGILNSGRQMWLLMKVLPCKPFSLGIQLSKGFV